MAQFHVGMKLGNLNWQPTNAKTESAAKRVAQMNRTFQRTIAHVAIITANSKVIPIARRDGGAWIGQ